MSNLEKKIAHHLADVNKDYHLIEDGDRVMVGISGGKDSWVMLHILRRMQRVAPIKFEMIAFHLDQRHPGFPTHVIKEHLEAHNFEHVIYSRDTYSVVKEKLKPGDTTCSLCSRMRRGIMYDKAVELGCNKIALGHHRDDILETLLLNLFFSGQLKAMPPKLVSDDGRNVVIRPLAYCPEDLLEAYAKEQGYPILPCTFCGTQPDLQRDAMKALLDQLSVKHPETRGVAFAAVQRLVPSHLLDLRYHAKAQGGSQGVTVSVEEFKEALPI
jgi:tRNA 2-thiocytidine biosynthesis protein TtcA